MRCTCNHSTAKCQLHEVPRQPLPPEPPQHPEAAIYTRQYFERPTVEREWYLREELRPDELVVLDYASGVSVLSVGCGLGLLEQTLANRGFEVTAVDLNDNREHRDFGFIRGCMDQIPDVDYDTVFFCESIEHIAEEEFERNWPRLVAMLRRSHGRLIIANWDYLHPIPPNGLDHIRQIDDELFDRFSAEATKVVFRRASQLVLEF